VNEAVVVEGLRHQYPGAAGRTALDDVSFRVVRGECFGLLGPNGGGKTTLFRILTTLLTPSGGRASVYDNDVVNQRAAVRGLIGVVFQSPSLDVYLKVRENLLHGGHLYGMSGPDLDGRISENLKRFDIEARAGDLVKSLSGGLRRRVELAKCLLHRPSVLILDEPTSGLDPVARRELWDHLEKLRHEMELTILVTTHDMEEAERCNRLVILDRGRVVAAGPSSELKAKVGKTSVSMESNDPDALRQSLAQRFGVSPVVIGNTVRLLEDSRQELPGEILSAFGHSINSLTVGKPTLGDVFMQATGRTFDAEASQHD
jgi:ABC-2 type transport system ATP-binding protein